MRTPRPRLTFFCLLIALSGWPAPRARADERAVKSTPSSKSLDFSGDIVEGANRQSMDSLVSFSRRTDAKEKPYLYHKRDNFEDEHENSWRALALGF